MTAGITATLVPPAPASTITFGSASFTSGWRLRSWRIIGWYDGAAPEETDEPRTGGDGVIVTGLRWGPRDIALEGMIEATSLSALQLAMRTLRASTNLVGITSAGVVTTGTLTVNDAEPRQATVHLVGGRRIEAISDKLAEYLIPLRAADPRLALVANPADLVY